MGGLEGDYVLLAANDLGMHCADQDHQVFGILPPFNVVHAQVVKRGFSPVIMNDELIEVDYLATSSPNDPVGGIIYRQIVMFIPVLDLITKNWQLCAATTALILTLSGRLLPMASLTTSRAL